MKLYFHPGTDMAQAMAETVGYVNRSRAFMPPGTVPPFVMRFDAGSVPVGYLVLSSETRSRRRDLRTRRCSRSGRCSRRCPASRPRRRSAAASARSSSASTPTGCARTTCAPDEVVAALVEGQHDQPVGQRPHRRPDADRPGQLPGRRTSRSSETSRSAPTARGRSSSATSAPSQDASDIPTGYALVNGRRTVYILVTKRADASTLDGRQPGEGRTCRRCRPCCPTNIKVSFEFDQSPYVTRAIAGLAHEGAARRGADRADGAAVPARLAQRDRRRAQHPASLLAARWSRCG